MVLKGSSVAPNVQITEQTTEQTKTGKIGNILVAKAKNAGKAIAKLLPGANIGLGVASAAKHLQEGNYGQALMAGISAIPGPIGYAGLAGEMGLGALQKYRQNQANGGLIDLYKYGGYLG